MKIKKKGFFTLALALIVGSATMLGLSACGKKTESNTQYAQDFYAMSAISSFNYLQNIDTAQASTLQAQRPAEIQEEDVQNIAGYMGMFKDMLASDTSDYYANGVVAPDDQYAGQYHFKMSLTVPSLDGSQQSFSMYYNEVYTNTDEEIDDNVLETETNTTLSGIIISGDDIYNVEGMREYEQEGKEIEIAIEFRAFINDTDYILIEHEMEDSEVEYQYTISQNGQREVTEVEFENSRKEKKLELEFVNSSQAGKNKVKYEITQSANNENVFNVRVKNAIDGVATGEAFTITVTEEGYVFSYSNGFSETILA